LNTSQSGIPVIARKNAAISGMLIQNQFTSASCLDGPTLSPATSPGSAAVF
jgi:hypothetical protein